MQSTEQLQSYLVRFSTSSDIKLVFLHMGIPITQQQLTEITFLFPSSTQAYQDFSSQSIFLLGYSTCYQPL